MLNLKLRGLKAGVAAAALMLTAVTAHAADPIKIGFSMALTGGLAFTDRNHC